MTKQAYLLAIASLGLQKQATQQPRQQLKPANPSTAGRVFNNVKLTAGTIYDKTKQVVKDKTGAALKHGYDKLEDLHTDVKHRRNGTYNGIAHKAERTFNKIKRVPRDIIYDNSDIVNRAPQHMPKVKGMLKDIFLGRK